MNDELRFLTAHNGWANRRTVRFLQDLDPASLHWSLPGGMFGTIMETLAHMIDSEGGYLLDLGATDREPWPLGEPADLATWLTRVDLAESLWDAWLARGPADFESPREFNADDGSFEVVTGLFVAQALTHSAEHRGQIGSILGAHGVEPPSFSSWGFGFATGRMREKS